ncbi:MAG: RNA recognition motif domain-containing protein [Pseudanabaenaceae cyanobacterium]|jgi:RNA recognition motif-containing protein
MSIRLYVGNLPAELDRQALENIFNESGEAVSLKVITDRKTGRCRGFGFVTVDTPEIADTVIEKFNGYDFNGTVLKLEKALPRAKGGEGEGGAEDESAPEATATPSSTPKPSPAGSGGGASKRNKKKKKPAASGSVTSSSSTEAHQPDPRWANQLEMLKQQLLSSQG